MPFPCGDNSKRLFLGGKGAYDNKPTLSLCGYVKGHCAARWNGFTCQGGGGSLTFSTKLNAISIRGSYLCLKKAEKRNPIDWHSLAGQVTQWGRAGGNSRKWCYITVKAHSHSPLGSQGENRVLWRWQKRGEEKKEGIMWMFGVKVGLKKKRGVWEMYRQTGKGRSYSASLGEDGHAQGQKKLCVYRHVASHYNAWGTSRVSV